MVINIKHPMIGYTAEDSTFCAELSDIEEVRGEITRLCRVAAPIYVFNPITRIQIKMTRFKVDSDEEDTYGWWYQGFNRANGRAFKFLFIND
jgi:hypothetical protein